MDRRQQREEKKQRFTMIAGLVGSMAGKGSVASDREPLATTLPAAEAAQIDFLIEQRFYASREEFLQTAVHNLLLTHVPEAALAERSSKVLVLGVVIHSPSTLEKLRAAGKRLELQVTGVLRLTEDVTPELACEVIQSIKVSGMFMASSAVKAALADRTHG